MGFFTREQIGEIERKLYHRGSRDSEFVPADSVCDEDFFAIVQDSINKRITFGSLFRSAPFNTVLSEAANNLKEQLDNWRAELDEFEGNITKKVDSKLDEVQQAMNSLVEHGAVVSTTFGNSDTIGISQKTLTQALASIWKKFEQITGEPASGIELVVTPNYFISETDCKVHISALHSTGIFDSIKFYANDELIAEAEGVKEFTYDTTIDDTTEIKCVATIFGIEYMEKKTVTKYYPFFIGSGTKWDDIVKESTARPYNGNIRGEYDIRVENEDDRMFIIIPASLKDQIIRADMNGFEIPFTITNTTEYIIYTSNNTYKKGVYNIDIN